MTHRLTLKEKTPVTHDTLHYVFDRPEGFEFTPGQAVLMRPDREGWRDEERPFTMVNAPGSDTLEFVIKAYPGHDGVTVRLAGMDPGDHVLVGDAWGAIRDDGPGTFVAGGAGITPFISILKDRARRGALDGCTLVYSNDTEADIILRDTWDGMEDLRVIYTLTKEDAEGMAHGMIDADFLKRHVGIGAEQRFYICGPKPMEYALSDQLRDEGVPEDRIIREDH